MTIDLSKFKEAFFSEAKTLINTMNNALMELEKNPDNDKLFQEVYRGVHTLKSLAGSMTYQLTMDLCHTMENLLEAVRNKEVELKNCMDLLFKCLDFLSENIKSLEENKDELDSNSLMGEIKNLIAHGHQSIKEKAQHDNQTIEVTVEKIKAIEVKVERLDVLFNLAEELLVSKMKFDVIREQAESSELSTAVEVLGRLITELQFQVMQIRLVPIGFIFDRFLRMTRDLAKQQKKEINLEMEGADIELDRLLIDEIGESLAHLIRNAIDHGLETPELREEMQKPPQGTIWLRASRSKELAVIEVSDDGAGVDLPAIKDLAIKRNILKVDASDEEVNDVMFSGISTSKVVTEISGRGLGLSIVKQKIESIGGNIRMKSVLGQGTSFFIEIPLSLAIIKTLFVTVANEIYAIPIETVERLLVVTPEDFKGLLEYEAIIFEDGNIPLIRLSDLFHKKSAKQAKQPVVIVHKGEERIGIVVDGLLSTQEIVVKPLNRSVRNNKFFSGAALIGSGQMILILDIAYLVQARKRIFKSIPDGLPRAE